MNDQNFCANLHRKEAQKDRMLLQDPRDTSYWYWWRFDADPNSFNYMVNTAFQIGAVVILDYANQEVNEAFDAAHKFTDNDFEHLLEQE